MSVYRCCLVGLIWFQTAIQYSIFSCQLSSMKFVPYRFKHFHPSISEHFLVSNVSLIDQTLMIFTQQVKQMTSRQSEDGSLEIFAILRDGSQIYHAIIRKGKTCYSPCLLSNFKVHLNNGDIQVLYLVFLFLP